ncbi:MAG: DUF5788 family protein [Euryarchaeota archaeon]|nr:DUF5788 family protein [Euryarchaeota archaeon]
MGDDLLTPCDDAALDEGEHCLTKTERERIISRIHSALFWVGELIPDSYEVDGKVLPLKDTIFRIISDEDVTDEDIADARKLAAALEPEARRLERELKDDDSITRKDARVLLDLVLGLLRGVDELRGLDKEGRELKKAAMMKKVDDEKIWLKFLDKFNH